MEVELKTEADVSMDYDDPLYMDIVHRLDQCNSRDGFDVRMLMDSLARFAREKKRYPNFSPADDRRLQSILTWAPKIFVPDPFNPQIKIDARDKIAELLRAPLGT